jgi:hypothetical protein
MTLPQKIVSASLFFPERAEGQRVVGTRCGEVRRESDPLADLTVPVLYLILRFRVDLAVSGGSDPA